MQIDKAVSESKTCRLPVECFSLFTKNKVPASTVNLQLLADFCHAHEKPKFSPWKFQSNLNINLSCDMDAASLERRLATWAMQKQPDWSWLPILSRPSLSVLPAQSSLVWRPEQVDLERKLRLLRPGGIGLLEASTGIGKTLVFATLAHALSQGERVIIAVPTFLVGKQWQETLAALGQTPMAEAWGRGRYGSGDEAAAQQQRALDASRDARVTLCSHHLLPKLFEATGSIATLLVDEAHLLGNAVASVAGYFVPIEALGNWFVRWYSAVSADSGAQEIELSGRLLSLAVTKLAPKGEPAREDWRASVVRDDSGIPMVWLRHDYSTAQALQALWCQVGRCWLFSGTLSGPSATGMRCVDQIARRLNIPPARRQDLGRVRASWRDRDVTIHLPASSVSSDGRMWLGAYRDRRETWRLEVVQLISRLNPSFKTLVLFTSYDDISHVQASLDLGDKCIASRRDEPFDDALGAFSSGDAWLWLSTGSAWTGLDLIGQIRRVVIASLPLPDPKSLREASAVGQATFDAVNRFKQGLGRLVRSPGSQSRELYILDGRINDKTRAWRRICQPFLQVLGEEFEHHLHFAQDFPVILTSPK